MIFFAVPCASLACVPGLHSFADVCLASTICFNLQVAAQALELARHRDELTDASVRLGALDDALAAARKALADQKHEALSMQSDGKALSDKMVSCMRHEKARCD